MGRRRRNTFANLAPSNYYVMLSKDGYYEWHAIEYDAPSVVLGHRTTVTATLVPKFSQGTNLALQSNGATATASGYTSYGGDAARPDQANDGTANIEQGRTFWSDGTLPAWLIVTLPSVQAVRTIAVHQNYHDLTYLIEGSTDGANWTTLVPETFTPHSGHAFTLSSPVNVKKVRLTVTNSSAPFSHLWKSNVYELELWQYSVWSSGLRSLTQVQEGSGMAARRRPGWVLILRPEAPRPTTGNRRP
jgi:hypothetical protein